MYSSSGSSALAPAQTPSANNPDFLGRHSSSSYPPRMGMARGQLSSVSSLADSTRDITTRHLTSALGNLSLAPVLDNQNILAKDTGRLYIVSRPKECEDSQHISITPHDLPAVAARPPLVEPTSEPRPQLRSSSTAQQWWQYQRRGLQDHGFFFCDFPLDRGRESRADHLHRGLPYHWR